MKWTAKDRDYIADPYYISSCVHGYSCWVYGYNKCSVLGRDVATLAVAQAICERHRELQQMGTVSGA